jgi:hypothetical protein
VKYTFLNFDVRDLDWHFYLGLPVVMPVLVEQILSSDHFLTAQTFDALAHIAQSEKTTLMYAKHTR